MVRRFLLVVWCAISACNAQPSLSQSAVAADQAAVVASAQPKPAMPAPSKSDGVDLDGDGANDQFAIIRASDASGAFSAIPMLDPDGKREPMLLDPKRDKVVITMASGARQAIDFPFIETVTILAKGATYPADAVLCWPLAAPTALLATGEEGRMIVYARDGALVAEACGA
jgi:hypothetical protein